MGAQVESSSSFVRNFFFNEPAQICATCLFIQTHELFLSAPSEVIINRLGVLSLVPFCSQPYSASQPSAALLWMKNWARRVLQSCTRLVVGAECVSYGLRNREACFPTDSSVTVNEQLVATVGTLGTVAPWPIYAWSRSSLFPSAQNTIALLSASQMLSWALIYAHALHLSEPGNEKVLPIEWAATRNMKSSNRKIANKNSEVSLPRKSKNDRPVPLVDVEGDVAIF